MVYALLVLLALAPLRMAPAAATDSAGEPAAAAQLDGMHHAPCHAATDDVGCGQLGESNCDACASCFAALPTGLTLGPAAADSASPPPLVDDLAHHHGHPPFRPPRDQSSFA